MPQRSDSRVLHLPDPAVPGLLHRPSLRGLWDPGESQRDPLQGSAQGAASVAPNRSVCPSTCSASALYRWAQEPPHQQVNHDFPSSDCEVGQALPVHAVDEAGHRATPGAGRS